MKLKLLPSFLIITALQQAHFSGIALQIMFKGCFTISDRLFIIYVEIWTF